MPNYGQRLKRYFKAARIEAWKKAAIAEIADVVSTARGALAKLPEVPTFLIDNSAIAKAITHRNVWLSAGTKLWGGEIPIDAGCLTRVTIFRDDSFDPDFKESLFLTGLSELAHSGDIRLVTSAELYAETLRQPRRRYIGRHYGDLNLFNGIKINSVDGYHFSPKPTQQAQADRLNTRIDERYLFFKKLLSNGGVGTKVTFDAWHLYTVERFGLDGFLTMDGTLVRSLARFRDNHEISPLARSIMMPSMLAECIALKPLLPRLFTYRGEYFTADHAISAEDVEKSSKPPKAKRKEAAMPVTQLVSVKEIRGGEVTTEMDAVSIQYEAANGDLQEMSMSLGDALYLLSLLKGIQIKLDIPFPDDPTDLASPAIRPSERR